MGVVEGTNVGDFQLLAAWIRALQSRNFSANTLSTYRSSVTPFIIWCHDHDTTLAGATHADVLEWLESRHLGPRSSYSYTSRLATFYRWAVREEHLAKDPTLRVDRPRLGRLLPRPADQDLVRTAMGQADPRVALMLACGHYAGMRRFEIAKIRVEDLLLRNNPPMIMIHGKGGKDRTVPLHAALLLSLRRYGIPKSGYLFLGRDTGRPLTPGRVGALITRELDGIRDHTTPHQLRHGAGTRWYQDSHDLRLVQELLGHSSPNTTAGYTQYSNEDAIRVVTGETQEGAA